MSAEQQEEREDGDRREHAAHEHGGHEQVLGGVTRGLRALLRRRLHAFARGPEAAQQRIHRDRDRREHGDLAERVEAAKIDEDHVDDVGAAALRVRVRR